MRALLLALLLPPAGDSSGTAAGESPLVGFAIRSSSGEKSRVETGVLDARNGAVLWRAEFAGNQVEPWTREWANLQLVMLRFKDGRSECHAFSFRTGERRFKAEGWFLDALACRGRTLLAFRGKDRMIAVDPATGAEAWGVPLGENRWPTLLPTRNAFIVQDDKLYRAFSGEDGTALWERPRDGSDHLTSSGGRLWVHNYQAHRAVEVDFHTGRETGGSPLPEPLTRIIEQRDFIDVIADKEVVRIRGSDLSRVWTAEIPASASYGWGDDRTLVLESQQGMGPRLMMLDAATGRLLADESLEEFKSATASLNHPRYLIKSVTPRGGATVLRIFDRRDGRIAWKGEVEDYEEGWAASSLLIHRGGELRSVDLPSAEERWTFPLDGKWKATQRRCGRILVATTRSFTALDASTGRRLWTTALDPDVSNVHLARPPRK